MENTKEKIKLKLKQLSKKQRENIYNNYMIYDFHKSEVKPFETIEKLVERGNYVCVGCYEDTDFLGYAYFVKSDTTNNLLLDYFAVNEQYRSKGLGSKIILTMKEQLSGEYSSLLGEVENPEFANDDNDKLTRERRIAFYLKNGFKVSNVKCRVSVDNYVMINLGLDKELNDKEIYDEMNELYNIIFGEAFFKNHISVSI